MSVHICWLHTLYYICFENAPATLNLLNFNATRSVQQQQKKKKKEKKKKEMISDLCAAFEMKLRPVWR